jgi:hypothetical protein
MRDCFRLIWFALVGLFRSRVSLETEILVLRHQLSVLQRKAPTRSAFRNIDRLIFSVLYRAVPSTLNALTIVSPETVIRWHRAGFRAWWRWKSRPRGGRPKTPLEIRRLIRDVSLANPLWGAPRIHCEPLKLGIDVGQTTVARYMAKRRRPPSQGWKTFLHNHVDGIVAMDFFVVPTMSFRLLFGLLILRHDRREIVWLGVTGHPTAEWIGRQLTEAFGWDPSPEYLLRDRDQAYGEVFIRRVRAMGIRDRPTAARSPWQNGYCERAIGSIRRDCLDHVVVPGERHLRHLLRCYANYYNRSRTHLSLDKDSPVRRPVHAVGYVEARPVCESARSRDPAKFKQIRYLPRRSASGPHAKTQPVHPLSLNETCARSQRHSENHRSFAACLDGHYPAGQRSELQITLREGS